MSSAHWVAWRQSDADELEAEQRRREQEEAELAELQEGGFLGATSLARSVRFSAASDEDPAAVSRAVLGGDGRLIESYAGSPAIGGAGRRRRGDDGAGRRAWAAAVR